MNVFLQNKLINFDTVSIPIKYVVIKLYIYRGNCGWSGGILRPVLRGREPRGSTGPAPPRTWRSERRGPVDWSNPGKEG